MRDRIRANFASLAIPEFRRCCVAEAAIVLAAWAQSTTFIWWTLDMTESPTRVGMIVTGECLPVVLLAPWAGATADRFDRHRVAVAALWTRIMLSVPLIWLAVTDSARFSHLLVFALIFGTADAFVLAAKRPLEDQVAGPERQDNAQSLINATRDLAGMIGQAGAGFLFVAGGEALCLGLHAMLILVAAFALPSIASTDTPAAATPADGGVFAGLRYIRRSPRLATALAMTALALVFALQTPVSLTAFAGEALHAGSGGSGATLAAVSLGSTLAGLYVAGRPGMRLRAMSVAAAAAAGTLLLAASVSTLSAALSTLVGFGAAAGAFLAIGRITVMQSVPGEMAGRVASLYYATFAAGGAIGAPITGMLVGATGPRGGLAIGALAFAVAGVTGMALHLGRGGSATPFEALFRRCAWSLGRARRARAWPRRRV